MPTIQKIIPILGRGNLTSTLIGMLQSKNTFCQYRILIIILITIIINWTWLPIGKGISQKHI